MKDESCSHCSDSAPDRQGRKAGFTLSEFMRVLRHTADEFFNIGKFFILGAFLSALFQVYVPRQLLFGIGDNSVLSVIIMVTFAYLLSVCSESDAFIARRFLDRFSTGSIIGFLVLGPMIDIKNTLMLNHVFKKSFVSLLIVLIFISIFLLGICINFLGGAGTV